MKAERIDWDGSDPKGLADRLRELQPSLGEVSEQVAEIIEAVRRGGDEAVLDLEQRFGERPDQLQVPEAELDEAAAGLDEKLLRALQASTRNIAMVSRDADAVGAEALKAAQQGGTLEPDTGRWWSVGTNAVNLTGRTVPVEAAGAYAPGGAGAYPSTVLMCCVPAKLAGVERIAVASPPGVGGRVDQTVLAAAKVAGADEVYATGGAQAVAALALGTESVDPVDVIVGPGNRYVTEAKRQLVGEVGIDGIAGPSELMVFADDSVEARLVALDLCAQAEHGDDGMLVACATEDSTLEAIGAQVDELAATRDSVGTAPFALVKVPSPEAAVGLADALAPEHLELACEEAEALSGTVRFAGCVFVGRDGATAFGDYAAGSNHVLPTGGAGRFQSPLSTDTFRRSITTVRLNPGGASELAPVVATLAEAEGFPVHGESATARASDPGEEDSR